MVHTYFGDNLNWLAIFREQRIKVDCVYADCIYESEDFRWANHCRDLMKDNAVFYVQTDHHTIAEWKIFLNYLFGKDNFINELIYVNDWGGTSKRRFSRKHDNILMYSKGKDYKFYYERILIPKVTAGTKLDKKGTGTKIPPDVFYDHPSFSTIAKEREKLDGHNIQWQKPLWLMDRLLSPVTDERDLVLDPFMGSGTSGVWSQKNNREYIGIEADREVYDIADRRLNGNSNSDIKAGSSEE